MDKRIEELVEWGAKDLFGASALAAAMTPIVIDRKAQALEFGNIDSPNWESVQEWVREFYRNKAKRLYSHPDLALIDREKKLPNNWWLHTACRDRPLTMVEAREANCLPIIPLAEALKESNG